MIHDDSQKPAPSSSAKVIQNLFAKPQLAAAIPLKDQEQAAYRHKAFIYLMVSFVFLFFYVLLFFYPHLNRYLNAPAELSLLQEKVRHYDETVLPQLEETRLDHQAAYQSQLHEIESVMDEVFPSTIDKTGITERLETFASLVNSKTPPFELNGLNFGPIEKKESMTILPISTQIHASRTNLERLMKLIDLSGRLDTEYQVRLMEIEQIDIRFLGTDSRTGEDLGVDASIRLKAYSRI